MGSLLTPSCLHTSLLFVNWGHDTDVCQHTVQHHESDEGTCDFPRGSSHVKVLLYYSTARSRKRKIGVLDNIQQHSKSSHLLGRVLLKGQHTKVCRSRRFPEVITPAVTVLRISKYTESVRVNHFVLVHTSERKHCSIEGVDTLASIPPIDTSSSCQQFTAQA